MASPTSACCTPATCGFWSSSHEGAVRMNILSAWLRAYLPRLDASDRQLADDLTLCGIAVEGVFDVTSPVGGSLFETDITTNRVDAMNHYGIAREAAAIYGLDLTPLQASLPEVKSSPSAFSVQIAAR